MKSIIFLIAFWGCCVKADGQKIIYNFGQSVIDTLRNGISQYSRLYHKADKDLKLYALVSERDGNIDIYLQEYSTVPVGGLTDLIKSTGRAIKINNGFLIPVLIPADKLSSQLIRDKIGELPMTGFYIKVSYEKYKERVVKTAMLF